MYHRIAEPGCDPWQLAVSPDRFEQQLKQLRQEWKPVSLPELIGNLANNSVRNRSVALTFDDGYLDNFAHARPLLEHYNIPATFFITTQNCIRQHPFWWDELESVVIHTPQLPRHLSLLVVDEQFTFDLGDDANLTPLAYRKHQTWVVEDGLPTLRTQLYFELWRRIKPCLADEQQQILRALKQWANLTSALTDTPGCMTTGDLTEMASNSLFTIGAHTVTHPALACHPEPVQLEEIRTSKVVLENTLGRPVNYIAYPYGNYNADSLAVVDKEGFSGAVTTQSDIVTHSSNRFRLGRYQVNNWDGLTFSRKLQEWTTRH